MRSAVRGSSSACHDAPVLCGLNIPVVNELLGLVNRSREKRANTIVGHTRAPAGVHACAWLAADSWLWRRFRRWCASAHLRLHLRRSLQPAARLLLGRHGRTRLPRTVRLGGSVSCGPRPGGRRVMATARTSPTTRATYGGPRGTCDRKKKRHVVLHGRTVALARLGPRCVGR